MQSTFKKFHWNGKSHRRIKIMNQSANKSKQNKIPEHNSCLIYEYQY